MKRKAFSILIITALLTACGGNNATDHFETYPDISISSVHYDYVPCTVRSEEVTEEVTRAYREDAGQSVEYYEPITKQRIIDKAYELYGVSEDWVIWLIGTTNNEQYWDDRYLEYAWACEILNCYSDWSVWDLDCIWGAYYSFSNAYAGYWSADDTTLEMVWNALVDTDTRIVEVDGMIRWDVPGYYLIYDSDVYNCQVWGN